MLSVMKQIHLSLFTESPNFKINSRIEGIRKTKGNGLEGILNGLFSL